ncbi:MAG: site-2 protease family protein [Thermoanaerobaculia bacterium]
MLTSSFRVARIAGIEVRVHVTFGLIILLGAFQWGIPYGAPGALFGAILMALLFFCVVLHELGHSLVARAFGVGVHDITLYPIGGIARMEKNPETPLHEFLIAGTGPLVNFVIALALWGVPGVASALGKLDAAATLKSLTPGAETALVWLLLSNLFLALFNLIPAFPMDGGRMLRAILTAVYGFQEATRIAAGVGRFLAVVLGLFGILTGNFLLALVALFIFMGASQERAAEQARVVLGTLKVGDAYNKNAITLAPGTYVSQVVDHILTSHQRDFAVMQGSALVGVVTRDDILKSLATELGDAWVTGIMKRDVLRVDAGLTLEEVREKLTEAAQRVAAVYRSETYLGLISAEDIAEALVVISFRAAHDARRAAAERTV